MSNQRYSPEFKIHALKRASEDGVTDKAVCEELGMSRRCSSLMRANPEHSSTSLTEGRFSIPDFGIFLRRTERQMSQPDMSSATCAERIENSNIELYES